MVARRTACLREGKTASRRQRQAAVALGLALLGGCTVPYATVEPGGRLAVLGPAPDFTLASLAPDWLLEGRPAAGSGTIRLDGVPALRFAVEDRAYALVRHTRAVVLATPYLSWAWNMEASGRGLHPLGLAVGFHGGDPRGTSQGAHPLAWLGTSLPPHDRRLVIRWGDSALQRGSFVTPTGGNADTDPMREYVQRGGRENAGQWWLETVDLADLYRRAWPDDDIGRAHIVFVGIWASAARHRAVANVSGILLSR